MKKILILNGPNLNMVGVREPGVYGTETLDTICGKIKQYAESLGLEADFLQSNHEGVILDKIHSALQLCPARRDCRRQAAAFCGSAYVQYPRARGISSSFGNFARVRWSDLRFWREQLSVGRAGVDGHH